MLIAAVMGHLAGWILEYGDHPAALGHYAHFIGVPFATFRDNLIGSHSHEMAVASMALVLAAALAWEVPLVGATAQMTMVSGYTAGLVLCRFTCSVPSPAETMVCTAAAMRCRIASAVRHPPGRSRGSRRRGRLRRQSAPITLVA